MLRGKAAALSGAGLRRGFHHHLPGFWLGLGLIYFFAVKLGLLPVMGRGGLKHLVLPAVTLGFGLAAVCARILRAGMLDVLGGHLLGGAVIVETIFAWPGVGKFAVDSIFNRDYPVIQGYALFMAAVFVLVNLLVGYILRFPRPAHPPGKGKVELAVL
ncbi:ABC transporter permease [Thermodesulfitimonas sp.]